MCACLYQAWRVLCGWKDGRSQRFLQGVMARHGCGGVQTLPIGPAQPKSRTTCPVAINFPQNFEAQPIPSFLRRLLEFDRSYVVVLFRDLQIVDITTAQSARILPTSTKSGANTTISERLELSSSIRSV